MTRQATSDVDASAAGTQAVIVVDHGSRRAESNRRHEEFVARWAGESGFPIVRAAHMELAEPSIATAFAECEAAGATTIVVVPYFLGPGTHWDRDIPALAAAAAGAHPDVRYLVTAPLGPHPLLMRIVEERIDQCVRHASGSAPGCALCEGTSGCALR